jgi:hypothetical protein
MRALETHATPEATNKEYNYYRYLRIAQAAHEIAKGDARSIWWDIRCAAWRLA